jgi:hypothetical protein
MMSYKPVSIAKNSFAVCRYGVAVLVWLSFVLHAVLILEITAFVFLLSAILKVQRAPFIILGNYTINRIKKSSEILVNENAIFFAHCVGFIFSCICIIIVYTVHSSGAWFAVLAFALLKSISAFGFCPASKLYDCALNGNCCVRKKPV